MDNWVKESVLIFVTCSTSPDSATPNKSTRTEWSALIYSPFAKQLTRWQINAAWLEQQTMGQASYWDSLTKARM